MFCVVYLGAESSFFPIHQPMLQARNLVKKLQGMRSPMASVLEKRIDIVERLQILQFRKIRTIPRPELNQHIEKIVEAKIALPFRLRLDLLECQIMEACADFFTSGVGDPKDITARFVYWVPPVADLQEDKLTMTHILTDEHDRHQKMLRDGEMSADEEADLKKQVSEAGN